MSIDWARVFDPTGVAQAALATAIVAAIGAALTWSLPKLWKWSRKTFIHFATREMRKHDHVVEWYRASDALTRIQYQNYIAMRIRKRRWALMLEAPWTFGAFLALNIVERSEEGATYWWIFAAFLAGALAATTFSILKLASFELLEQDLFADVVAGTTLEAFEEAELRRASTPSDNSKAFEEPAK